MKKIIILIITIILICIGFIIIQNNNSTKYKYLKDFSFYKKINIDQVTELEIVKYNVGGDNPTLITDKEEIIKKYNSLGNIKVGKETNLACEDNTTVYYFVDDKRETKIEIECDWIIINNKRYLIYKN